MKVDERAQLVEVYDCVTEILKCKWTLAILDAIARGVNRPGRLERELPGLTTKVLNERIRKLERYGIIVRQVYPEIPPRVEYLFTERGKRLLKLLDAVNEFARQWNE
ncbi:MAG: transcriptional regulator [Armatimonadota bacterium]|nr:MAG: transcriptional regulator [Armatimonadota bacterium]